MCNFEQEERGAEKTSLVLRELKYYQAIPWYYGVIELMN